MYSDTERLLLLNQYLTLQKLAPDEGWDEFVTIVQNGYEGQYRRLTEHLYEPLNEQECRFVEEAMATFDALQRPYADAGTPVPKDLAFPGFDGNNEAAYLGYAEFLVNKQNRWTYLGTMFKNSLNSHMPVVNKYRRMIDAWKRLGSPHLLADANAATVRDA
jgi:uncharacterized protein YfbU (UPF0304 family)